MDFASSQVESPSQISQGTVSVASELEDTLAGVPAVRRVSAARPVTPTLERLQPTAPLWPKIVAVLAMLTAIATAAAWYWHVW
jgi:hypothetical protein